MHSCWMTVLVSTSLLGWGSRAGRDSCGDRQGLSEQGRILVSLQGMINHSIRKPSQMSLLRFLSVFPPLS